VGPVKEVEEGLLARADHRHAGEGEEGRAQARVG